MDPQEYTEYCLLAQSMDAVHAYGEAALRVRDGVQALGEAYGRMYKALREGMEAFARGFQLGSQ
jgi:hypothetical protein